MSQRKEKTLTWDNTISSWRVDLFSGAAGLCEVLIDAGRCQETMVGKEFAQRFNCMDLDPVRRIRHGCISKLSALKAESG